MPPSLPASDRFTLPNTSLSLTRIGYGAMQLAGPHVWGPPADRAGAVAVLREAVALGVNHIDTADFYGPHVTNEIIREALHPYAADLTIVTKVGYRRGADQSWLPAHADRELVDAVHDNLRRLGLDVLDVVNLRARGLEGPEDEPLAAALETLTRLQRDGLIRHIGLSQVTARQVAEARRTTDIVCVQNHYNLAHRDDDALIDTLAAAGIAYVPYFPLGGFSPLQSSTLTRVAEAMRVPPMQVALAWLLRRAPNILVIPGTASLGHLRENVAAGGLELDAQAMAALDAL